MKIKDITSPTPYKNKSQNTENVDLSLVFEGVVTYSAQPPYISCQRWVWVHRFTDGTIHQV